MPDLNQLRELGEQVRPPSFDSLVTTAKRRNRRAAALTLACATLIVLVGAGLMNAETADRTVAPVAPPDGDRSEKSRPTYSSSGGVMELPQDQRWANMEQGRYGVRLSPTLSYEVSVPDGWRVFEGSFLNSPPSESGNSMVFVAEAPAGDTWVPRHPCTDHTMTPVGPSVSDLAEALKRQPLLDVSEPDDTVLDSYHGLVVDVRIPETVITGSCLDGRVDLFSGGSADWGSSVAGFAARWWILDVDGKRLVVCTQCVNDCTDSDWRTLHQMVENSTFPRDE